MANGHGGKREGGGRPPGALAKKTRAIAEQAAKSGISPLEVMLEAMNAAREEGNLAAAAGFAKDAAPYMHPRLANVESNIKADVGVRVTTLPKDEAL